MRHTEFQHPLHNHLIFAINSLQQHPSHCALHISVVYTAHRALSYHFSHSHETFHGMRKEIISALPAPLLISSLHTPPLLFFFHHIPEWLNTHLWGAQLTGVRNLVVEHINLTMDLTTSTYNRGMSVFCHFQHSFYVGSVTSGWLEGWHNDLGCVCINRRDWLTQNLFMEFDVHAK
jgi:hypothetical protein